jgi:RimJ/RimL family protein N-acetyltransferase
MPQTDRYLHTINFSHEGTLRRAERVYDQWLDHEVYALLMDGRGSTPRA